MSLLDERFPTMGVTARVILADRVAGDAPSERLDTAARAARQLLQELDAAWTRFDPDSELSRINARAADTTVPASAHLRALIRAGAHAGRVSGGLVDVTLGGPYQGHWDGSARLPLADALTAAPVRAPATADPRARWQALGADRRAGTIRKPRHAAIDSGGIGKGLAADLVAARLTGLRYVVDVGGDLALGHGGGVPHTVAVVHPLTGAVAHTLTVAHGGVATSGIARRIWRDPETGEPRHHLLDPKTRRPAWTGLLSATAVARTAAEAETLAKTAYLRGPRQARATLAAHGGVLIHESGRVEVIPALARIARRAVQHDRAAA